MMKKTRQSQWRVREYKIEGHNEPFSKKKLEIRFTMLKSSK